MKNLKTYLSIILLFTTQVIYGEKIIPEEIILSQHSIPPFVSNNLPGGGIIVKMIRDIYAEQDIKLKEHWTSPEYSLKNLKEEKAHISLGWYKNKARNEQFQFSDKPLLKSSALFYHLKSISFDWNTLNDLVELRIGQTSGTVSKISPQKSNGNFTIIWAPNYEQNIRNLLAGKVDVIIGSPIPTKSLLRKTFSKEQAKQITAHSKPLSVKNYYAVFSKQTSPQIIIMFNEGMERLRKSGEYYQKINAILNQ